MINYCIVNYSGRGLSQYNEDDFLLIMLKSLACIFQITNNCQLLYFYLKVLVFLLFESIVEIKIEIGSRHLCFDICDVDCSRTPPL